MRHPILSVSHQASFAAAGSHWVAKVSLNHHQMDPRNTALSKNETIVRAPWPETHIKIPALSVSHGISSESVSPAVHWCANNLASALITEVNEFRFLVAVRVPLDINFLHDRGIFLFGLTSLKRFYIVPLFLFCASELSRLLMYESGST